MPPRHPHWYVYWKLVVIVKILIRQLCQAIGVESKILVTMHHASGRAFDTAYNFQFSYLCSNTDVVEVTRIEDNAGFYVTALDLGSAVLSVSFNAGGKVVSNFLSLHSSTAIVPAFPVLHVGGIATFRTLFPGEGTLL